MQIKAELIYNKKITQQYFHLAFRASAVAREAQPGQFLSLKITDGDELLLRRPFSIHRLNNSCIEVLYAVVGKATEALAQKKAGEYLDVIGPLGNGFTLLPITYHLPPILVAGGMGVAPLMFLAEKLRDAQRKTLVLIGAKTKSHILCEKEFQKLGCDVKIATDDGSRGFKGKVTGLLKDLLSTVGYRQSAIYACGPRPMLKEISRISKKGKIPAQISLEEHMACGIGACLGCAVKTKEGFQRVCKDGPVFDAQEIVWE